MAGLLYFLNGDMTRPQPEQLEALGLKFDHPPAPCECIGRGPGGKPGLTLADPHRVNGRIGVYLAEQEWHAVEPLTGDPRLYIGWYKDQKPGPADLVRANALDGPKMTLGDGNEWTIPLIQEWNDSARCKLPAAMRRVAGQWVLGDVQDEYRAIWTKAKAFWETMLDAAQQASDKGFSYEFPGIIDFAAELLAINYVVSPDDIAALGLFTNDGLVPRLCEAAIDWPTFEEWAQKKSEELGSGDSSPGPEASPAITDQLVQTSQA